MNTVRCESVSLFTLTPGGQVVANKLRKHLPMQCYCAEKYLQVGFSPFIESFKRTITQAFFRDSAIIVVGACGIVVRTIAPLLQDKMTDPAVLVIDEKGKHVISLLSGHIGGANELARYISHLIDATPVITTSTDVNQTCSFDLLAKQMCAEVENFRYVAKTINQLLVSGNKVGIYVDPFLTEEIDFDIHSFDIRGLTIVTDKSMDQEALDALIDVSMQSTRPKWNVQSFQLIPRRLVAGIGCRKGIEPELLASLFNGQLQALNIHPKALSIIGSIDIKRNEDAILALAKSFDVPFELFTADELKQCSHRFPQSEFVAKTVGVGAVSQPAAWLLSNGSLLGETIKQQGITITYGVLN
jgi:cobalt-precorrin 5A hydrolase